MPHLRRLAGVLGILAALLAAGGCGSDEAATGACAANDKLDRSAKFAIRTASGALAGSSQSVDAAALAPGASLDIDLRLVNEASATTGKPLQIVSVQLVETDLDGKPPSSQAFACSGPDGKSCAETKWPEVNPVGWDTACAAAGSATSAELRLRYTRPTSGAARRLRLSVQVAGDVEAEKTPQTLTISVTEGVSRLICKPSDVDFGAVPLQTPRSETVSCANTGTGPVRINSVALFGALPLALTWDALTVTASNPYAGQPPLVLEAGASAKLTLLLDALTDISPRKGIVRIESDDPTTPRIDVDVLVNTEGPCLKTVVPEIDFGAVPVGVTVTKEAILQSCGTEPVQVSGVEISAASDPGFGVQFTSSCFGGTAPTAQAPKTLQPGATCTVFVTYTPTQLGATSSGVLTALHSAGRTEVTLAGKASSEQQCPVACFALTDALSGSAVQAVIPQTKLALDASCSTPGSGASSVAQYTWKLTQPAESYAALQPSAKSKSPSFTPNLAGTYEVSLEIKDDLGQTSCVAAKKTILVVPDDKLHLELTWTTPGDPDPNDEGDLAGKLPDGSFAGADMDLHLAHPLAVDQPDQTDADKNGEPDPWFAPCFDCSLFNPKPNWGDYGDDADDARLDRDDKDGWGPENINIALPEADTPYTIGVHYWAANSFGKSIPVVRVYVDASSAPAYVLQGPEMSQNELWCAGSISWPKNQWKPCKGANAAGVLLTKNYPFKLANTPGCE